MEANPTGGLAVAAALAAGLLGGAMFFAIWRRIVPREWSRRFWRALPLDVRGVLTSKDPDVMLVHYKTLLTSLVLFAGRNTLGLAIGLAPIALLFVAVTAYDPSSALATETEVYPPSIGRDLPRAVRRDGRLLIEREGGATEPVRVGGLVLDGLLDGKVAICSSAFACLVPGMLLFDTHVALSQSRSAGSVTLVRPRWFDANPFWPYLNDLDLLFFVAATFGSAAAAWLGTRTVGAGEKGALA